MAITEAFGEFRWTSDESHVNLFSPAPHLVAQVLSTVDMMQDWEDAACAHSGSLDPASADRVC